MNKEKWLRVADDADYSHVFYHKFHRWPPTVNTIWRNVGGTSKLSARAREFYSDMNHLVLDARAHWADLPRTPLCGYLSVQIRLYPPDKRPRDADNHVKAVWDAMTHAGIWHDDEQVKHYSVDMSPVTEKGGAFEIWISRMRWGEDA